MLREWSSITRVGGGVQNGREGKSHFTPTKKGGWCFSHAEG